MPEIPTKEVLSMQNEGKNDAEIIKVLTEKGFSPTKIVEALNQAKIKKTVSGEEAKTPSIIESFEEAPKPTTQAEIMAQTQQKQRVQPIQPSPQQPRIVEETPAPTMQLQPQEEAYPYAYPTQEETPRIEAETVEEIAEEVVNEKWEEFKKKLGDIPEWKRLTENKLESINERIKRTEDMLDKIQLSVMGKVQQYSQNVKDLGAEMRSLETGFSKILDPLIDNIKELKKITEKIKKK